MTYFRLRRLPAHLALACAAGVPLALTGCQPQTIIARVNDKPIAEQDFISAVQRIRQSSFQGQDPKMDAGAITLVNKIQSILVDQCASDPALKAAPSEDTVKAYFDEVTRKYPNITNSIKSGDVTQDDLMTQIRSTLEMLAIGTDGAKLEDKELQAEYDKHQTDHALDFPTTYTLKILLAPSREAAAGVLEDLKKTGNFKDAAAKLGVPPDRAAKMITSTTYAGEQLPPPTVKVLDTLTPNQYTPEPIEFTVPSNPNNPQAAPTTQYMIAQLVTKEPGVPTPKLADVRELVTQMSLQEKYPQWSMHAAVRVGAFTEKSNIQIMVDRYKPLLNDVILANAKRNAAMANGETGGGAPGAAPAPSSGAH